MRGYGDTVTREHRQDEGVDLTIVRSPARHARWRQQRVEPRSGRHLRRERLLGLSATIAHLTITGGYGGGIRVARTVLTLNDSTVTSNIGGRISSSNQSLTLNNSTVGENVASSCAGISGDNDSTVLTNSTVTRNIASSNGGGSATAPSGEVRPT